MQNYYMTLDQAKLIIEWSENPWFVKRFTPDEKHVFIHNLRRAQHIVTSPNTFTGDRAYAYGEGWRKTLNSIRAKWIQYKSRAPSWQ